MDIVALAANSAELESLVVYGEEDASKAFTAAQVRDDQGGGIVVKRNRRGETVMRWYNEEGEREQLSGLQRIEVELKK